MLGLQFAGLTLSQPIIDYDTCVAGYIYVQPVVSASAAWLVLDRLPAGNTLLAGALIALGVALSIGLVDPARWIRRRGAIDPPPSGSDSP